MNDIKTWYERTALRGTAAVWVAAQSEITDLRTALAEKTRRADVLLTVAAEYKTKLEEREAELDSWKSIFNEAQTENDALKAKLTTLQTASQQALEALSETLIASCSCLTKTNDADFHHTSCRYRIRTQAIAALTTSLKDSET